MNMMSIVIINSNSPWYESHYHYKDALLEKEWTEGFLKNWGFPAGLSALGNLSEELVGLRSLLVEAIDAIIAGEELPQELFDKMNRYLNGSSMVYEVRGKDRKYQLSLIPQKRDLGYLLSKITASFVQMISEQDTTRFKRCENPDCRSVFYDSSKNQARKWCCNTCSSLIKVRRHREKQKSNSIDL